MIDRIKSNGLCLGCGLCSSLLGKEVCGIDLDEDGFYEPVLNFEITSAQSELIRKTCPGIHVHAKPNKGVWGALLSINEAWSSDPQIRHKAASGGVVTSLAIFLLESHQVDAILQVGVSDQSYLFNELKVSKSKQDIINNAQSRYAPAKVFNDILGILDSSNDVYGFIGKPCDIAAIQNLCNEFPKYQNRIKFYISIFCAGMPSYWASISTWKLSGHEDSPIRLKYRGDGWPGEFVASFSDGSEFQMSYADSWGKCLCKSLAFRCKVCPDGIGMLADVAVGDSWKTKDGYPDFSDSDGRSFCMIRTERGSKIFEEAVSLNYITRQSMDLSLIREQQTYQYERRKLTGWRLIPVIIQSRWIISFRGLGIFKQAMGCDLITGMKNMRGTAKRLHHIKHGKQ